ncbi:hypothetical protein SLS59_009494 [Nothophoma quercina]|uniref:EthD domain-containing protein n=1 Tax=Nothophoma quercina TaxID=749835 RepID=A0ABR3QM86_9PLEO
MVPKTFEAGYPNSTGFRKVVKATIYIKKKEGMSDADFIEYYNNNHAQRAVPILQRHGIISYSLTYHLHRDRKMVQDIMHGKAKLMEYDAISLNSDHENFMDDSQMKMMVGDEYMLVENGEKVV